MRLSVIQMDMRLGESAYNFAHAEALLRRAGRTVPRGAVARAAWGPGEDASDTRLEVQVSLLRGKLRAVGAPARVRAVRGIGYLIEGTGDEDGKR